MKCKFCNEDMLNGYLVSGHDIFACKNHDVIYMETDNCMYFGKDGFCFFVHKNSEDVFLVKNLKPPVFKKELEKYVNYFKGIMYADFVSYRVLCKTESIDIDIYNFDKMVEKLIKLKAFS